MVSLAPTALAQRTFVVDDDGGPGVDFTAIQPAVDAAVAGDRILIRGGFYSAPTITKGVALFAGRDVTVDAFTRPFTIRGVPVGEVVSLNGFERTGLSNAMRIESCRGTVILQGLGPFVFLGALRFDRLDIVSSSDVRLVSAVAGRVLVDRSNAVFESCVVTPELGGSQVTIRRGEALFVASEVYGMSDPRLPGITPVRLDSGTVRIVDSLLATGLRTPAVGAPAIAGTGSVVIDSRSVLRRDPGTPAIEAGITVTRREIPILDTTTAPAGGTVEVALEDVPGAAYGLLVGLPAAPVAIPGIADPLAVAGGYVAFAGTLDAAGQTAHAIPLPANLDLLGVAIAWQAAVFDPAAPFTTVRLSNPSTYVHPDR